MAIRIVGVDIPQNKCGEVSLTYIYGIGRSSAKKILAEAGIDPSIKNKLYYIPIEGSFLKNKDKESFNKKIFKHVRNYQTNG